jgi:CRISPR-associated exonuclease Cas4
VTTLLHSVIWFLALVAVALVVVAIYSHRAPPRIEAPVDPLAWLPAELYHAQVVAVESDMNAVMSLPGYGRVRLFGRPDQVYRLPNGLHVPLEYKTRDRAVARSTDSDQLALQAWMLRQNDRATAPFGFVVCQRNGSGQRTPIIVPLAGDEYAQYLVARYLDVRTGKVTPGRAEDRRCESCGHHQATCNQPA